jgi:hypothetical protein
MDDNNREIHIETDEARGGSTPNIVRWVLAIGLLLAVIGMSLAWIIPAATRDDGDRPGVAAPQPGVGQDQATAATTSSDTDSIVSEEADESRETAPAASSSVGSGSTDPSAAVPTADNPAKAQ